MNAEYTSNTEQGKPHHGPENGLAERGRRPHARNELYACAAEFKRRHPKATAADAWAHFAGLAGMGVVVVSHSAAMDAIEYVPDSGKWGARWIKRISFERHYRKVSGV